jgi:hypothetical protein
MMVGGMDTGRFPDEFAPVEEKYIDEWDKGAKAGKMVAIKFLDFSTLLGAQQGGSNIS